MLLLVLSFWSLPFARIIFALFNDVALELLKHGDEVFLLAIFDLELVQRSLKVLDGSIPFRIGDGEPRVRGLGVPPDVFARSTGEITDLLDDQLFCPYQGVVAA